jgi:hypothetical protein
LKSALVAGAATADMLGNGVEINGNAKKNEDTGNAQTQATQLTKLCLGLQSLFAVRCARAIDELKGKLMALIAANEGKPEGEKKAFRDVVYEANLNLFSDEIQAVAASYAEWESMRVFCQLLSSNGTDLGLIGQIERPKMSGGLPALSPFATASLGRLALLYGFDCVEQQAVHFLSTKLLTADEMSHIKAYKAALCRAIRPDVMSLVDGLGIDENLIWRPMAKDWKTWNEPDNFGEVVEKV